MYLLCMTFYVNSYKDESHELGKFYSLTYFGLVVHICPEVGFVQF